MGGNNNQQQSKKKSSSSPFAAFNFLKGKRSGSSRKVDDSSRDDSFRYYKVFPSDEDTSRLVAKPGIDMEASAYIAKIHAATREYSTGGHDRPY